RPRARGPSPAADAFGVRTVPWSGLLRLRGIALSRPGGEPAARAEARIGALGVIELIDLFQNGSEEGHHHELCDAVAALPGEGLDGVGVMQGHLDRAAVSGIDDTGAVQQVMPCLAASPERGQTMPTVPGGRATARPVSTSARPPGGISRSSALARSSPASSV